VSANMIESVLGDYLQKYAQFLRFCVAGALNTAINYGVFYAFLVLLGVDYLISGALGFAFAVVPAFLLNRAWTFASSVSIWRGFPIYLGISIFTLGLHSSTQWLVTEVLGVPEILSQLCGIVVTTLTNFFLIRKFVFFSVDK
jgi:putative flippase GtrA